MINRLYWDENVINPIKEHISKKKEIIGFDSFQIKSALNYCKETEDKHYILDELYPIYKDFCLGKNSDFYFPDIILCLMQFDQAIGKVIPKLDLVKTAFCWAENNDSVRVEDFIEIVNIYDHNQNKANWCLLEQRVNQELVKLKVFGDSTKGGYLALLHGFIRIKICSGNDRNKQKSDVGLLTHNWDFIRLVYSVMIHKIIDSGNRDFAAVANNMFVQKSSYKYIHIFYAAAKERIDVLCESEKQKEQINYHLGKLQKEMQKTPQDYDTLDGLCKVLFTDEFQAFLDKNRFKSYDEIMQELMEMQSRVDAMNNQVEQMAQQMVSAVNDAIPIEDIERELLRLLPGSAYDVFSQVNSLLTGNKAWNERAAEIKNRILEKRDSPTIVNGNLYQSGSIHQDESKHLELLSENNQTKLPSNE